MDGRPALDGYYQKLEAANIPSAYLAPVADVDEIEDLAHCLSCARALRESAKYQTGIYVPRRVLEWADAIGIKPVSPPNENHDPRQYFDDDENTGDQAEALPAEETEGIIK